MNNLLDIQNLKKILNKITHNTSEMSYTIEESLSTASFYITIYYKDVKRSARISDHLSNKKLLSTLLIGKHTKRKTIESFLTNVVKKLMATYEKSKSKGDIKW